MAKAEKKSSPAKNPVMNKGLQSKSKNTLPKKSSGPKKEDKKPNNKEFLEKKGTENEDLFPAVLDKINKPTPESSKMEIEIPVGPEQIINEKLQVKYIFTDEEKMDLGAKLAMHIRNVSGLNDEISSFVSQKKAQVKQENERINEITQNLNSGYEYRDTMCRVKLNDPEYGKKSYYKHDGTLIETQSMLAGDYQSKMNFDHRNSDQDDKAIEEMDKGPNRIRD